MSGILQHLGADLDVAFHDTYCWGLQCWKRPDWSRTFTGLRIKPKLVPRTGHFVRLVQITLIERAVLVGAERIHRIQGTLYVYKSEFAVPDTNGLHPSFGNVLQSSDLHPLGAGTLPSFDYRQQLPSSTIAGLSAPALPSRHSTCLYGFASGQLAKGAGRC